MKLLRWAAAGASVYVVYKYSIGKKAKGEDVFKSPDRDMSGEEEENGDEAAAEAAAEPGIEVQEAPKPRRRKQKS